MRVVLDTSVIIGADIFRSGCAVLGREGVELQQAELAVSVVTLAELHFGVLVTKDAEVRAERLRRLSLLQQRFSPLPVDSAVAGSYGFLAAAVVEAGRQPRARSLDLLIAATAHAHEARLLTRNASDLRGLEQLVSIVAV